MGVRFPDGGALRIEFTDEEPEAQRRRSGAWLELQSGDPSAVRDKILAAGLPEMEHTGHDFYFVAPGGQVFSVEAASR